MRPYDLNFFCGSKVLISVFSTRHTGTAHIGFQKGSILYQLFQPKNWKIAFAISAG